MHRRRIEVGSSPVENVDRPNKTDPAPLKRWDVQVRSGLTTASVQLAHEQDQLAQFGKREHQPLAFIWESDPALVVSPSDLHLPRFAAAARQSEAEGWPVSTRVTGGSAVPLAPGVINLSLIASWRTIRPTLGAAFQKLCGVLIDALENLGVSAITGHASRAFCDGRCNILVGDRKIAGTAQRQSSLSTHGAVLLHAAVILDADPVLLTDAVARFYAAAGDPRTFDADAVSSVARITRASGDELRTAFIGALANALARPETVPAWCDTPSSPSSPAATSAGP
ncbi:MAG TPA: hypothetical protein VIH25_10030 [Steroidobacteraceae bacterium]